MLRALYIGQESEDFAITVSLADKERPGSNGASETVNNDSLGRGVSGDDGDLHGEFLRVPAGRGRLSEKTLQAIGQRRQILTHFHKLDEIPVELRCHFTTTVIFLASMIMPVQSKSN